MIPLLHKMLYLLEDVCYKFHFISEDRAASAQSLVSLVHAYMDTGHKKSVNSAAELSVSWESISAKH